MCASPAYLARHGTPEKPSDLANHFAVASSAVAPAVEWKFTEGTVIV
ncbi:MAG: hypothetical protein ACU83U_04610 [Gammaproteobacteria bacterium]